MGSNLSISEATNGASAAAQKAPARRVRYIAPAALTDVMFEQLDYLVAHKSRRCSPRCDACMRLNQIESLLLAPFRTSHITRRSRATTAA